jgi:CBS domain containing-hemolysin-like protein
VLVRVLAVIALVCLNGFFVGAEFALVRARRTRLEARASEGDRLAALALRATSNISAMLSASQLGVTLASLGLGWVAQSALEGVVADALGHLPGAIDLSVRLTIAAAVALAVVTYLHVVFGELAPKGAALLHPEAMARWLVPPLMVWAWITKPITVILNRSSQALLRGQGRTAEETALDSVHSPEELRLLVEQAEEKGALEGHDAAMIDAVFEFSEKSAREVMTPRTEIVALPSDATLDETLAVVLDGGFSRYPVYTETIDNIVGILLAKDLITVAGERPASFTPASIMRPAHVIPGSREVEDVLADFKRTKDHMAIVLDEYGGTAGIVTMEDLLEEIVGEIFDEYDETQAPTPTSTHAGELNIDGSMNVGELNSRYELSVPEDEYTTIGGFVFGAVGRLPAIGDHVSAGGATFTVREMDGRRVATLGMELDTTHADGAQSDGSAAVNTGDERQGTTRVASQ